MKEESILETIEIEKRFGGIQAISAFNMAVKDGEIVGIIGPNGAGKSTLFNLITGIYKPSQGSIIFRGCDIKGMKPHKIASLGIGRTFQMNPLFANYSTFENISISFHLRPKTGLIGAFLNTKKFRAHERLINQKTDQIIELLGLGHYRNELAKNLPHGYQKLLGVARALAIQPKLLLLDEPLGGMNPQEIDFVLGVVKRTREEGVTILLVEHNMQILDICDRVIVISFGQKVFEGLPNEVKRDEKVIKAYFGGRYVPGDEGSQGPVR